MRTFRVRLGAMSWVELSVDGRWPARRFYRRHQRASASSLRSAAHCRDSCSLTMRHVTRVDLCNVLRAALAGYVRTLVGWQSHVALIRQTAARALNNCSFAVGVPSAETAQTDWTLITADGPDVYFSACVAHHVRSQWPWRKTFNFVRLLWTEAGLDVTRKHGNRRSWWVCPINSIVRKAATRLNFLKQLKRARLSSGHLLYYYRYFSHTTILE